MTNFLEKKLKTKPSLGYEQCVQVCPHSLPFPPSAHALLATVLLVCACSLSPLRLLSTFSFPFSFTYSLLNVSTHPHIRTCNCTQRHVRTQSLPCACLLGAPLAHPRVCSPVAPPPPLTHVLHTHTARTPSTPDGRVTRRQAERRRGVCGADAAAQGDTPDGRRDRGSPHRHRGT